MAYSSNPTLTGRSQKLRREMTKEERHLWYDCLKDLPVMVHRQKIFGHYIVDFYIAEKKLVIELDGSQHYENLGREKDAQRDAYLQERGITVVRYSNEDVNRRFADVCQDIWNRLDLQRPPSYAKK